ncbi:MAG: methylcrotonoyl-CoA carboxylase, partial [Rhizobiales bacterium]|nr:methylcrotonoyl-CoA carboxylase [Hyphomicrobiales bacterium]
MPVLTSTLAADPLAGQNRLAWQALRDDLMAKREAAALGGPVKARERHLARGKLLPRERV